MECLPSRLYKLPDKITYVPIFKMKQKGQNIAVESVANYCTNPFRKLQFTNKDPIIFSS